ncbi:ABC transporter permease [Rhodoferax sp. PAMC 29310]|uniref:ABC transporter permease n=1 Tax=Rhodoferax sp. PAMC 29310 TaxID=2822760 RepID=UPI001F0A737B|nr:ABC transporter permease [Rhodoferax sp. PAMC 29310]
MSPMLKQVAQRVAMGLLLLLGVSGLIFVGTQLLPGDPAHAILGQSATPEALANLRQQMGLNDPPLTRYWYWLSGFVVGDFGQALSNGQDIASAMGGRLLNTLFLAACAALVSVPLAVGLGLLAVKHRGGVVDRVISGFGLASTALPEFFVGYGLMYFFAVKLQWFTSVAMVYAGMSLGERLSAIVLPVMVLTLGVLAHMMRMTRAAILNVMQSAYIETAELKGLSALQIIYRHALPNALAPIISVVMLNLAFLIVGVVVVEVIFVYPGIGQYLVDHVAKRDVPVVQACSLVFASVYIGMNIFADVAGILSNPRLRHPK